MILDFTEFIGFRITERFKGKGLLDLFLMSAADIPCDDLCAGISGVRKQNPNMEFVEPSHLIEPSNSLFNDARQLFS